MRYFALATDYDGTIAHDGRVEPATVDALQRIKDSGRKIILVTGRELADLNNVFPALSIFDAVVAENGGVLYSPATQEETLLADPIPEAFAPELKRRKVKPVSIGRVIVSTLEPHENTVLETIRDLGLELQVIFNKGAVMVLPSGVNKATGLGHALARLDLSLHNAVGIGDAENDLAFLNACEFSVAVANALPSVKDTATYITQAEDGAGVRELIEALLHDDLRSLDTLKPQRLISLGQDTRRAEIQLPPFGPNVLLAGSSGSGKSTLAKLLLERLGEYGYQYCVIDPEGDYEDFEEAVVLGDRKRVPANSEVVQLLRDPARNAVINLLGVDLKERPAFFGKLFADLLGLRASTGRPHWIILDEAHHLLPQAHEASATTLLQDLYNVVYITVEPAEILREALMTIGTIIVVGDDAQRKILAFAEATGTPKPRRLPVRPLKVGEAFIWQKGGNVRRFRVAPTRFQHQRHRRKYAEGDLGSEFSFYFRGPAGKLNLKAQNLITFVQLAEGVDDETWQFHRQQGDYSRWFVGVIKDPELAEEVAAIEKNRRLKAAASRKRIKEAIAARYTLPATDGASRTSLN